MPKKNKIFVTQPTLPDLKELIPYLEDIWQSKRLTNNGKYHQLFEKKLAEYLNVKYVSLFTNGTLALVTALQTLRITGEVITTPFSFVATANSLIWNNLKPVFVDIEPVYCNIDPEKMEAAITQQTTAILAVHVYGNPCNVKRIQEIADTYGLKVIYDAAHTFNNKLNGTSILNYGDLSILSFHATKPFNTMEGGAIISHDEKTKKRIDYLKNFGFADEVTVMAPGINSKMNEMQAALGLLQLKHYEEYIAKRKAISDLYRKELNSVKGIEMIPEHEGVSNYNYPYFPVLVDEKMYGKTRDKLYEDLKNKGIYGRRYFYPLISQFSTYRGLNSSKAENLPTAEQITKRVICLPIYPDLDNNNQSQIINLIKQFAL
ncbi:MAG: DegT/DnrJ/EryC1/StrS family aminotransferase [Bacteroidales bacterium]|nr:DegT/DnrJ/EryC1/StrS family aminotransferase [Bacteroidales bacterium]